MKIIELQAENVKRLKAVEIKPDGTLQVIGGRNAQGKAQPLSEPILTPRGWVTMRDIHVGSEIIGSDGEVHSVTHVFPQTGTEVWEVTFADGSTVRCSPDHLWDVESWVNSAWTRQTLTIAEIVAQGLRIRGKARRWAVPIPEAITFDSKPLPIDPYTLGLILGDAHIADTGYVQLSTDSELIDALGVSGYRRPSRGCDTLGSGEWAFRLEALGLAGLKSDAKFIPDDYLWSSIEDRWALLQGLMDTDGTPLSAGSSEFATSSLRLARGMADLARSLGLFAKIGKPAKKRYSLNGEKKESKLWHYRVRIRSEKSPFRLARKDALWFPPHSRRPIRRFIESVERVDDEATRCIRVSAPDQLYVTRDYVLTHNSSVLDAIWLALGGGKAAKETMLPIRDGEEKASVRLDLGDLVITRSWTKKGTSLKVANAEGATYSSPQSMLDTLVGRLSFDPLEFTRLSAKDQREALLGLVDLGIDIDELARQRNEIFAERSEVGRRGKAIGDVHVDDDLPVEETSAQDIIRQIREAEAQNRQADDAMSDYEATTREVEQMEARVDALRQQLTDAEGSLYAASQRKEMKLKAMKKFVKVDVSPLEDELEGVEELNQKIRANNAARKQAEHKADLRADYELLTEKLRELDERKASALAAAVFPVEGLGFDDTGVTYRGVPFSQASSAEQIRVSVAMAMAMNPKLRVLRIKDGSLLDDDAMTALREQVAENDFQLWIERVGDADEGAVIISDGEVAA